MVIAEGAPRLKFDHKPQAAFNTKSDQMAAIDFDFKVT
jgi:hypothetical protein